MFFATGGIYTHKGANFIFGIILSAITYGNYPNLNNLIILIKQMTCGLVKNELENLRDFKTFGEIMYRDYSITGIRGEVEQGLPLVTKISLPIMFEPFSLEINMKKALLALLSSNDDTNMLKRVDISGLQLEKKLASQEFESLDVHLNYMNDTFIKLNLNPGGSADLLAVTHFLYSYLNIL